MDDMDEHRRELADLGYMPGELDPPRPPSPSAGTWTRPLPPRNDRPPVERSEAYFKRLGGLDSETLGLGATYVSERLGIAAQTVRDWRREGRLPRMWVKAVRALVLGEIGGIDQAWKGWSLSMGRLCAPESGHFTFTPAEVRALRYQRDAESNKVWKMREEIERLRAEVIELRERLTGRSESGHPKQGDLLTERFERVPEPPPTTERQLAEARAELDRLDQERRATADPPYRSNRHLWGR